MENNEKLINAGKSVLRFMGKVAENTVKSVQGQMERNNEWMEKGYDYGMKCRNRESIVSSYKQGGNAFYKSGLLKAYRERFGEDETLRKLVKRD